MVPESLPPPPVSALALPLSSSPPHAVAPSARAPHAAIEMRIFFMSRTLASPGTESVIQVSPSCKKDVKTAVVAPLLGGEPVAEAEVRVDVGPAGKRLVQLLAQPRDVHVDRAVGLPVALVPDHVVELLARHDPVAPLGEGGEQVELAHGQPQRAAIRESEVLGRADLELTDDHLDSATVPPMPANTVISALPACENPV